MGSIFKLSKIYCNNSAAVSFSNSRKMTNTNKPINVTYLTVNERINSHQVSIDFIGTACMIANLLMKGIALKVFKKYIKVMGICH